MQSNSNKKSSSSTSGTSRNKKQNASNRPGFGKSATSKDRRNDKPKQFGQSAAQDANPKKSSKKDAKKGKELDFNLLIQPAKPVVEEKVTIETRFDEMNIHPAILGNLGKMGFVHPTEIQVKTYDQLVEGENLIGIANTGTGKTGAFLIPVLQRLLKNNQRFLTLVVVPTRELALQVFEEFNKLTLGMKFKATCFIGGTNIEKDLRALKSPYDIVIATPGRLIDLKDRGGIKLTNFEVLILDEFDKMLDMGFIRDVRRIVDQMRNRKQTLLFSATKDPKQATIIDEIISKPLLVQVSSGTTSSTNVDQNVIHVKKSENKFNLLVGLLRKEEFSKVILFSEMKHVASRLSKKLNASGIKSDCIHGDKSQNYRVNALDKFKNGQISVLVATDVAARGIDVSDVTHVINYQLPKDYDTYIHRVGRTGRAGKTGIALTFVDA
ncbi:DEAD/DEAH box helicase [Sphingobacterium hungaricum]|uniref:ATP-dependent helicase n=1 Tax=Sphingobacterium hungaricum TaxID=2082723 RepID=A0A928YRS7_9SPHI|nr:DEAD/DEAH box helicase [Sphingobacterium hungaricum]MBE8715274.1 ATP-dependent helicase [Sphingobacterium hungaricum]